MKDEFIEPFEALAIGEESLRRTLAENPSDPAAIANMATYLSVDGRLNDAIDLYRAALRPERFEMSKEPIS